VLRRNGRCIGNRRVERLMQKAGIVAKRRRKFRVTTDSKHKDPIAPNLLERRFDVALPDTAWVTDVTYVWTLQGWLYLAAINMRVRLTASEALKKGHCSELFRSCETTKKARKNNGPIKVSADTTRTSQGVSDGRAARTRA